MQKRINSTRIIEISLALLLPVVLLVAGILSGLSETKIPVELTLRTNDFNFGLFDGVNADIETIGDFNISRDIRSLISMHMDPFFLVALLIPASATKAFLYIAYFLKFGLASLTMNRLLRKQLEFGAPYSCLLGVIYSLSSPVIVVSSYSSMMNVIILLPLVMDCIIEFYKNGHTLKNGLIMGVVTGMTVLLSGNMALLYVLPFVFCASVFLAACTSKKFSQSLVSLICAIPYLVIAVLIGGIVIVNQFVTSDIVINKETLMTFNFRITMFDMINRLFDGKPLATGGNSPVVHMTVFVLFILLAFFLNSKIPLRIRATLLFILVFYHFSFSSQAWYRLSVIFASNEIASDTSSTMRFACISALLIFASAVSLKNIHLIDRKLLIGCAAILIAVLIVSNNGSLNETPSFFSLYFSALAVIVSCVMIINVSKIDARTILAVILFGLFINLSFILPISRYGVSYDEDSVIFDKEVSQTSYDLPFDELEFLEKDMDKYIVLHNFEESEGNEIEKINSITTAAGMRPLFSELSDCKSFFAGGRAPLIDGNNAEESRGKVESYVNINLSPKEIGQNMVIFSNHEGEVILEITSGNNTVENLYKSPVMEKINVPETINYQAKFIIPRGNISNPNDVFEFYLCSNQDLAELNEKVYSFENTFTVSPSNDGTTLYTILTAKNYSDDIKVKVNGVDVETMNIYGKLAFVANPNVDSTVEISTDKSDLLICFFVSLIVTVCSIVVVVFIRFKGEKSADN